MAVKIIDDIPEVNYFISGNKFSGSIKKGIKVDESTFNYKIIPKEGKIEIVSWFGVNCIDKSKIVNTATFELTTEGVNEMINWINENSK